MKTPLITLPHIQQDPLRVLVTRADAVESCHDVDIALCDGDGQVILGMGQYESVIYPRSAMKPLQALALLELLDELGITNIDEAEYALFCASHNGEALHSDAVIKVLQKFDISPDELVCGAHWSLDQETLIHQVRHMSAPQKAHNNCSGKHAGMLILAKLLTGSTAGYEASHHACQQKILGVLEAMTGSDLTAHTIGIDGCGAPVYRAPLGNWARAFALFASGGVLPPAREQACLRLRRAIARYPDYIAGQNRACSAVNQAYGEAMTVKVGAEGVYSAAFHHLGLGLMLKTRDGSKRGAEVALGAVVKLLGFDLVPAVLPYFEPDIYNWAGTKVGAIKIDNWP